MNDSTRSRETGFEGKSTKAVITTWLYCDDVNLVCNAAREMRKRFQRAWPRPYWIPESLNGNKT